MHILEQHEISQFPNSNRDSDKGLLALGTQPERSPKLPLFRFVSPPSKTLKFGGTKR